MAKRRYKLIQVLPDPLSSVQYGGNWFIAEIVGPNGEKIIWRREARNIKMFRSRVHHKVKNLNTVVLSEKPAYFTTGARISKDKAA